VFSAAWGGRFLRQGTTWTLHDPFTAPTPWGVEDHFGGRIENGLKRGQRHKQQLEVTAVV